MISIVLPDPAATEALGRELARRLRPGDSIALFGTLGAGKTSLCRGIIHGLGFAGEVSSPTYPIVQTYQPPEIGLAVWHVDLYRVEAAGELDELGLEEGLAEGALLIEWPERLLSLWPETLQLTLSHEREGGRGLTVIVPPAWGERWPLR